MCTHMHIHTCMHECTHTHTEAYHLEPKPEVIIIFFIFATVGSPNAEAYCWISKFRILTGNAQPKSFGLCLLIFKFHNDILPASKNSITVWKTITQPPIDSSKTIIGKSAEPHKASAWRQIKPSLGTGTQTEIAREHQKDILKSILMQ